jgi:ATP-dependent Clp protease ATP-binding subunit ClpB
MKTSGRSAAVPLDPTQRSADAMEFETRLGMRVIGQDEAVSKLTLSLQTFMAGLSNSNRTISNMLFLGPTGTGKTRLVEASCEVVSGDSSKFIKIDCSEFQESHSIAKLIGSPAGYVGHRETKPFITQERINSCQSDEFRVTLVLFDEIEKASPAFFDLLLGILDKGKLTTATGDVIDFTRCVIIMTSNLGSKELSSLIDSRMGFAVRTDQTKSGDIVKVSMDAARRHFRPEFFNRIDHVITFKSLDHEAMRKILSIELGQVQKRILSSPSHHKFIFTCSPDVEEFLINEGTDRRYGARHLKRAIEKYVVEPLAGLVMSGQVTLGDLVRLYMKNNQILFEKIPSETIAELPEADWADCL